MTVERRLEIGKMNESIQHLCEIIGGLRKGQESIEDTLKEHKKAYLDVTEELFTRLRLVENGMSNVNNTLNNGITARIKILEECANLLKEKQRRLTFSIVIVVIGITTAANNVPWKEVVLWVMQLI